MSKVEQAVQAFRAMHLAERLLRRGVPRGSGASVALHVGVSVDRGSVASYTVRGGEMRGRGETLAAAVLDALGQAGWSE